jgi:hypothetical protein
MQRGPCDVFIHSGYLYRKGNPDLKKPDLLQRSASILDLNSTGCIFFIISMATNPPSAPSFYKVVCYADILAKIV